MNTERAVESIVHPHPGPLPLGEGGAYAVSRGIIYSRMTDVPWRLREHAEVTSTNLIAADLPAWHAVRADTQTAGRGRFQRQWVSDVGGLWLSAVVPVETNSPAWRMLPLATGLAVCQTLRTTGVKELRLRWPNDVLVRDGKLAGLLIDQFKPGLAVVGIGINVRNQPQVCDASLRGHVARLADLVSPAPSVRNLAVHVLASLKIIWQQVLDYGPVIILERVNELWDLPRRVEIQLDSFRASAGWKPALRDSLEGGPTTVGEFLGVDVRGRLQLRGADGAIDFFEPQDVRLLRDIP